MLFVKITDPAWHFLKVRRQRIARFETMPLSPNQPTARGGSGLGRKESDTGAEEEQNERKLWPALKDKRYARAMSISSE